MMNGTGGGMCPYQPEVDYDAGLMITIDPYDVCINACYSMHSASVQTYKAYSTCYLNTCQTECPQ
jgi:hypothetical protein